MPSLQWWRSPVSLGALVEPGASPELRTPKPSERSEAPWDIFLGFRRLSWDLYSYRISLVPRISLVVIWFYQDFLDFDSDDFIWICFDLALILIRFGLDLARSHLELLRISRGAYTNLTWSFYESHLDLPGPQFPCAVRWWGPRSRLGTTKEVLGTTQEVLGTKEVLGSHRIS